MKLNQSHYIIEERGFTLIEVMISIVVFTLIGLSIVALVSNIIGTSNKQGILSANADQARKLSFSLMNELRNATTSSTGAYALDTASDQQLIYYSNVDGGTDIERIRYYVAGGKLYRGVVKPTGSPLVYNIGTETSRVVQENLANGATPVFYYFADTYSGSQAALTQPVNVTQAKFIRLNLQIYNKGGVKNTNYYTITASGTIRNLKTNLGN